MIDINNKIPASFRDEAGFVFKSNNTFYRTVEHHFKPHYDVFKSNLYPILVEKSMILSFEEVEITDNSYYKILKPKQLIFKSYPFEWSFEMLKKAALLTLSIQKICIENSMTLKDASAYNIEFVDNKPIHIDLLSFEKYNESQPWIAYRQFCEHFLGPLLLMSKVDMNLNSLWYKYHEGFPLALVSKLLPFSTKFNLHIFSHIHLHAKYLNKEGFGVTKSKFSKHKMLSLLDSLETLVINLKDNQSKTNWSDYYNECSYSTNEISEKKEVVSSFLSNIKPTQIWDIGCNTGEFSILAGQFAQHVIATDYDVNCINHLHIKIDSITNKNIIPLINDITQPSPALGWNNQERESLLSRINVDTILALALIHHLYFSKNINFEMLASMFKSKAKNIIIEFVPFSDSQVKKINSTKLEDFNYSKEHFENTFSKYFELKSQHLLTNNRIIYWFSNE